jgi:hypothetical protein
MESPIVLIFVSLGGNVVLGLLVYSLRTTIRGAVSEALLSIAKEYATKNELAATEHRLNQQIGLSKEVRSGFNEVLERIS